jgi:benzoate-CoA ligase
MLQLSSTDQSRSPPRIEIPSDYNAAHDLLERNLRAGRGSKVAYVDDDGTYTFAELVSRVDRCAHALVDLGLQPEQRALLCLQDTIDFPTVFLGCIKAGVVPIGVNTMLKEQDYEYMLRDSRVCTLVVSHSLLPNFGSAIAHAPLLKRVIVSKGSHPEALSLSNLLAKPEAHFDAYEAGPDTPCFWLYSSGSTGAPKGAIHVHSSLIQTAELYGRAVLGIDATDTIFSAAKLFFAYGLGNALTFPLSVGATTLLMAERPTPQAVFARLTRALPTIFCGVPTLYASLLADATAPDARQLRLRACVSAGECLPAHIGEQWRKRFGVDILDGIGSTEMLHIFLSNRHGAVQYGTTGVPVPGYDVRLLDDEGKVVADGEIGELQVRGPSAAVGYWNNREKSRQTFHGPWTRTGDKYYRDAHGCYVHAGRTDDMLKVGGIYVSPVEVEAVLISHASVLEAAVIGREDDGGLIKPCAFVVLKRGTSPSNELSEELKRHVKTQLAPYKYPRWIEYLPELPKTATGKIQRFRLREWLRAGPDTSSH